MSEFKKVNGREYANELISKGAEVLESVKIARVLVRQGIVGEEITTYVDTGEEETKNVIKLEKNSKTGKEEPGYVVTMATESGEPIVDKFGHTNTYIVNAENFEKMYLATEIDNVYKPLGTPRTVIQIPEDISIMTSWGEEQNLRAGSFLNITDLNDIYGIAYNEFQKTYEWTDKVTAEQILNLIDPNASTKNDTLEIEEDYDLS